MGTPTPLHLMQQILEGFDWGCATIIICYWIRTFNWENNSLVAKIRLNVVIYIYIYIYVYINTCRWTHHSRHHHHVSVSAVQGWLGPEVDGSRKVGNSIFSDLCVFSHWMFSLNAGCSFILKMFVLASSGRVMSFAAGKSPPVHFPLMHPSTPAALWKSPMGIRSTDVVC